MTSSGRAGRTAIKRPGAGIDIDRARLIRMRQDRLMSRAQLAVIMSNGPCAACGEAYRHKAMCPNEREYTITPDAIAKIENGWRRPKTATLARMCRALGCEPGDLLPPGASPAANGKPAREDCPVCHALFGHEPGFPCAT